MLQLRAARSLVVMVALAAATAASAAPAGSPWGRDYFGDPTLVTHEGKEVRFYTDLVEGKHVVVSFIYTRCTRVCGLMTANLARVARELGDRLGKDIHFYSITMDPEHDGPAELARYRAQFKAGDGWTFLTGRKEDVAALRRKYGDLTSIENHSANVNVGNDALGQWFAASAIDNPRYLARVIGDWLDPAWASRAPPNDYRDAPAVVRRDEGHALYRQKCAACHTMGQGGGVGPDLAGVVDRRGRPWLTRWLLDPEALLKRKDPTAVALAKAYDGLPMPNLALTKKEVAQLIDFMAGRGAEGAGEDGERRVRTAHP